MLKHGDGQSWSERMCLLLLRLLVIFIGIGQVLLMNSPVQAATIDVYVPAEIESGQVFPAQVYLNTKDQQTIGTDLLFSYDPQQLKFVQVQSTDFYPHYHQAKFLQQQQQGQLRYSGTADYQHYQQGSEVFANLFFKKIGGGPNQASTLSLDLVWEQDRTDDTNVIGIEGQDLLKQRPKIIPVELTDFPQPVAELSKKPSPAQAQHADSGQVLGQEQLAGSLIKDSWLPEQWQPLIPWLLLLLIALLLWVYHKHKQWKQGYQKG